MAKDGTARGGARIGSGKKPTSKAKKDILNAGLEAMGELPTPDEIEGMDVPPVKDYLKAKQKNGKDLMAEDVFNTTYLWLKKRGCERAVSAQLLEQYAMSVARWIQTEDAISEYGMLAKHPTTGAAIASPYVTMAQAYMKQINATWYQIYVIVKDNGLEGGEELDEQDLMMEKLLNIRNRER